MARIARVSSLLKALALISWRDARSLGSIAGQNFFLFVLFVAMQPESAAFFLLLLLVVLLFPLSNDPMEKIPSDRRGSWPISRWEWSAIRAASLLLSPVTWVGLALLLKAGWRAAIVLAAGAAFALIKHFAKKWTGANAMKWRWRIPAPPGLTGAIMRLQWRAMWHTLDPYFALTLMAVTEAYRMFGKALDPSASRIMSLVVVLALSTQAQVLFGIDGSGAERYRQLPIRGWQILLAKDLAFLVLVGLLAAPLDFWSGLFGGMAAVAVGHHQSVLKPVPQRNWRFTSGALLPHGALQTVALFAIGTVVRTEGLLFGLFIVAAWLISVAVYGLIWDKRR